ncbi:L,D-transpeptidase family protein [Streptomyces puniciscabiei]|uniref:L,D-transpeptidase family protein n=1 Tax=Streptomyces puniciscabiei TaxID=164348 RepID=UPI00379A1198
MRRRSRGDRAPDTPHPPGTHRHPRGPGGAGTPGHTRPRPRPLGVHTLSDAGGLLPDPGGKLPYGPERGGGVWLHVDHGGPTHGCVSVAKVHVKELLRTLDPARHPVVVMGHADWLAA